jgi:hypothetical protein
VDNVQEVDLQDDNNVDGNQGINAPPDDNREQTEVPVQPSERPQRLRRPPERLEYYMYRDNLAMFNLSLYVQCAHVVNRSCPMYQ